MRKVVIIGVPLDLGGNRRGVDMGPSALRITGLAERVRALGYDVTDSGDVAVPIPELCDIGDTHRKYAGPIAHVCEDLCERVYAGLAQGRLPVSIGGDHSLAMGSVAGVARHFTERDQRLGLLWFDAHGDMNTPGSTNSGNVHGMALAHLLGLGDERLASVGGLRGKVRPENVSLIGVRDLDAREKRLLAESGVNVFTMKDVDRQGAWSVTEQAIEVASRGTHGIHASFDIDVVDPSIATGVGTPKKGG